MGEISLLRFFILQEKHKGIIAKFLPFENTCLLALFKYNLNNLAVCELLVILCIILKIVYIATQNSSIIYCWGKKFSLSFPLHW